MTATSTIDTSVAAFDVNGSDVYSIHDTSPYPIYGASGAAGPATSTGRAVGGTAAVQSLVMFGTTAVVIVGSGTDCSAVPIALTPNMGASAVAIPRLPCSAPAYDAAKLYYVAPELGYLDAYAIADGAKTLVPIEPGALGLTQIAVDATYFYTADREPDEFGGTGSGIASVVFARYPK